TAGARLSGSGREVTAFVTHFGYFSMLERTLRPVVTSIDWTDGQRLRLRGDHADPAHRPAALDLRHSESGQCCRLPLSWDAGTFRSEERRGGEECRFRWAPYHLKKKAGVERGPGPRRRAPVPRQRPGVRSGPE